MVICVFSKITKTSLKVEEIQKRLSINILYFFVIVELVRGPFGKFVAWWFISVTDKQTNSCLVSS